LWPNRRRGKRKGVRDRGERKATGSGKNKLVTKKRITHNAPRFSAQPRSVCATEKSQIENLAREVPGEVKQIVPDALSTGRFCGDPDWPVLRCPPRPGNSATTANIELVQTSSNTYLKLTSLPSRDEFGQGEARSVLTRSKPTKLSVLVGWAFQMGAQTL